MPTPRLTPLAVAALRIARPERILVVEPGDGDGALFLAREFPTARVRGVSRDPDSIRTATARIGLDPEGRVAFKLATRRALPFPDALFDLVVVTEAPVRTGELARVLRAGGELLLVHPDRHRAPRGFRARLLARRLAGRGFEPLEAATAGDGDFSVHRLRDRRSRDEPE